MWQLYRMSVPLTLKGVNITAAFKIQISDGRASVDTPESHPRLTQICSLALVSSASLNPPKMKSRIWGGRGLFLRSTRRRIRSSFQRA